jgi:RND family efflux transporter MFP subunit
MHILPLTSRRGLTVVPSLAFLRRRLWTGLVVLFVAGCSHAPGGTGANPPDRASLASKVFTAENVEWPIIVRVQGSLVADEHATLSSRVAGLVETVCVDRGQAVKKGDVLVALRARDFDLKVTQAEAHVKQTRARLGLREGQKDEDLDPQKAPLVREELAHLNESMTKLERTRSLRGTGASSEEELQNLRAAVEAGQARYQSAQNQVRELVATLALCRAELALAEQARSDAEIRAPFDGIVDHKMTAPGVYVQPGTAVVTLVRTDPLRYTAGVPERRSLDIKPGQGVVIVLEGRKQPLDGKVTRVGPALTTNSRALTVEVDVPNPDNKIPANFFAEAEILVDASARTLAIPLTALNEFAGVEKVWLVRNGEASEQRVRTGRRNFRQVEVLEGLQPGDTILADARLGRAGPVTVLGTKSR